MENEPSFKDAKAWSDFIGFHVRMSFLMGLAWIALMPAIVDFMISFDGGLEYSPLDHGIEIIVFLFVMTLAIVMLRKIVRVVGVYLKCRIASRFAKAGILSMLVVCELLLMLILMWLSYLQMLNVSGVSRAEADRIGEALLRSYGLMP